MYKTVLHVHVLLEIKMTSFMCQYSESEREEKGKRVGDAELSAITTHKEHIIHRHLLTHTYLHVKYIHTHVHVHISRACKYMYHTHTHAYVHVHVCMQLASYNYRAIML